MAPSDRYHIHHSQNFLKNYKLVEHLVDVAKISSTDTVIEIGPGKGAITRVLARRAGHVLAIEQDADLVRKLVRSGTLPNNVTLVSADVLQVQLPSSDYRVFANIPFRHTAAIIGKLTSGIAPPKDAWLVVQREAAERYLVGNQSTMIAISLAPWFDFSIRHRFDRNDFTPRPNVDPVMLCIESRYRPLLPQADQQRFQQLVDVLFNAWAPTLRDAAKARLPRLAAQHVVKSLDIGWQSKVSTVSLDDWIRLYYELVDLNDDRVWSDIVRRASRQAKDRDELHRPSRTRATSRKAH